MGCKLFVCNAILRQVSIGRGGVAAVLQLGYGTDRTTQGPKALATASGRRRQIAGPQA